VTPSNTPSTDSAGVCWHTSSPTPFNKDQGAGEAAVRRQADEEPGSDEGSRHEAHDGDTPVVTVPDQGVGRHRARKPPAGDLPATDIGVLADNAPEENEGQRRQQGSRQRRTNKKKAPPPPPPKITSIDVDSRGARR
jgi:hypothetical protein